jgi:hypothetical protein
MSQELRIGAILMSGWPALFGLDSEPFSGRWRLVKTIDGFALDRKIRAAGWNFFLVASEVKVMFLGSPGAKRIQRAVKCLLDKVAMERFNGLEITGIAGKHFLGIPYSVISAHSRHVQRSCYLDGGEARGAAIDVSG